MTRVDEIKAKIEAFETGKPLKVEKVEEAKPVLKETETTKTKVKKDK